VRHVEICDNVGDDREYDMVDLIAVLFGNQNKCGFWVYHRFCKQNL
jgi:hypothetical protein